MSSYKVYIFSNSVSHGSKNKGPYISFYNHAVLEVTEGSQTDYFEWGKKSDARPFDFIGGNPVSTKNGPGMVVSEGQITQSLAFVAIFGELWNRHCERFVYGERDKRARGYPWDCLGFVDSFLILVAKAEAIGALKHKKKPEKDEGKEDHKMDTNADTAKVTYFPAKQST